MTTAATGDEPGENATMVGQEMSGWASLIERDIDRMNATLPGLYDLAIGGTAVGTGTNRIKRC